MHSLYIMSYSPTYTPYISLATATHTPPLYHWLQPTYFLYITGYRPPYIPSSPHTLLYTLLYNIHSLYNILHITVYSSPYTPSISLATAPPPNWLGGWVGGWIDEWVGGRVNEWMGGLMDGACECMGGR